MGCVEQAVLEFDEEVQAPWRPLLVAVPTPAEPSIAPALRPPASGRASSRVGACRPTARPVTPSRGGGPARPGGGGRAVPAVRPASTRVRLTRRARRLAVVLALCGGLGLGSLLGSLLSGDPGDGLHLAGVSSVVVEPGDTLWSIAESVGGGADVRDVVDRIQELNRLEGSTLVPGQVLQLP
jgi:nucleoid-associated protein YgaU